MPMLHVHWVNDEIIAFKNIRNEVAPEIMPMLFTWGQWCIRNALFQKTYKSRENIIPFTLIIWHETWTHSIDKRSSPLDNNGLYHFIWSYIYCLLHNTLPELPLGPLVGNLINGMWGLTAWKKKKTRLTRIHEKYKSNKSGLKDLIFTTALFVSLCL